MNYLPFTKPTLDEATIQGVVEVLRSGWLATGPKVQALEKALSDYLGGRIVRTLTSATGGAGSGVAGVRHRAGRRSHHAGMSFARHRRM